MTVQIEVRGRVMSFTLDREMGQWDSPEKGTLDMADFPLIAFADGKRWELYSDETFDNVEL
jgi:hypothetical protein